ncbi:chondroitinase family polysaccharide lyase [Agriterribacter sp.]|uniref:chondroitinase family polysaccharide lyase n=1 Tax=Agriterribacter sp. TaxID=2821509 RepID=UPI002CA14E2D|nr:chondroitinase family polysaccharide lyase [Agriterribacter sp.]HRP57300.1 chondroitinase family polysaccharide lyase [Agriterribacter sp.]
MPLHQFNPASLLINKIILTGLAILLTYTVGHAQPDLEGTVPSNYTAKKGTLSISDRHYRLGTESLRWDWTAGDTLVIELSANEQEYVNDNLLIWGQNHFEMWAHNETPSPDTFDVKFLSKRDIYQFRFRFNINYEGWRKLQRSYRHDMIKELVTYDPYWWNVVQIHILAPQSGSGTIFIDNMQYMRTSEMKYADRQMPDLAVLASEPYYSSDFFHQLDTLTPTVPLSPPTAKEIDDLNLIRERIKALDRGMAPSASELSDANAQYAAYNVVPDGNLIKGKDISDLSEIDTMFAVFTRNYIHNNSTDSRDKAINILKLMLDNGIAAGSGRWFAGNSWGYDDMLFYKALINAEDFIDEDLKYKIWDWLKWSMGMNMGWNESSDGLFDEDNFYVLQDAFLCVILFSPDDAHAVQDIQRLKLYIERFLKNQKGNTDGMKPDGTTFHHYGHYNAYAYSFQAIIDPVLYTFRGTDFLIDAEAYKNLRKVVYAQYLMCNTIQFANSLTGRHAFFSPITFSGGFFTRLAQIGGEILNMPIDPVVAGMRTRIYGIDRPPSGIPAEPFPSGFWQMNYSPLAMYRRDNWAATIKGINNYFWGTEISTGANRYGRYQSYGAVEIMYPGGLAASGLTAAGWDWNKVPGATTVVLPFSQLVAPGSYLAEKNTYNFAGGVKFGTPAPNAPSDVILADLHGDYGMFGLNFKQPAPVSGSSHNPGFIFRKSYFSFGNKIVCLGSNINNNDGANKTITTLFQGALPSAGTPTIVDGSSKTGTSQSDDLSKTSPHWLIDAYKTGYYVMSGNTIHVERQSQTSPDQSGSGATTTANFANAYLDHGNAPSGAGYAYVIAPNTTANEMAAFATDMESSSTRAFDILQQDTAAHIIRENASGVTGFSLFLPNDNLVSNDILKGNDMPCVAMMQVKIDTLRISLVNPDLNLVNNISTAVPITLTLYGKWSKIPDIPSGYANVISAEPTQTIVQFNPGDGLPAEIALIKSNEVILPIELLSFSGYTDLSARRNVLDLKVENDNETVDYYLERRNPDGGIWKITDSCTFAAATGEQEFSFYDNNIDAPAYVYRVKWQESSGMWQYSNIVLLKNKQQNTLTIAPNPAKDEFVIRLKQQPRGSVNWILTDASGKAVKQGRLTSASERISVHGLASGTYFLRLSTGETMGISVIR